MRDRRELEDIKNLEVRKEVFKILEIFEEGFLNSQLELVICHPVNPVDICDDFDYRIWHGKGRNVYCNYYFRTEDCNSKMDIKCKVLAWWSRAAFKEEPAGRQASEVIQDYVRRGINEYLGTNFSREDMELIYIYLGNDINRKLCEEFIKSKYDLSLLEKRKKQK